MQGAKAYILPVVAALLLAGWWIFGPDPDAVDATPTAAPTADPEPRAAAPASPLDRALDDAIATCGDLKAAGVREASIRIVAGDDGQARVDTVEVTPASVGTPPVQCLRGLAGKALPTKAPLAAVTRTRTW